MPGSNSIATTFHAIYVYPVPQNMLVYDKEKDLITWSFPESRFWRTETLQKHDHHATPKISVTLPTVDYGGGFNPSGENIIYMHDDDGHPLMTRWDNKTVTRVAIRLDPQNHT